MPPEWTGNLGMVIGWDAIVLHHVNYSMSALTDITLHSAGIQSVFCENDAPSHMGPVHQRSPWILIEMYGAVIVRLHALFCVC